VRASFFIGNIDPTDGTGQFKDRGREFRPVLYVANDKERVLAEKSQKLLVASGIYGQVRLGADASDYICVLILLYMFPHTNMCVLILLYMCPHSTTCPHTTVCPHYTTCVLIILFKPGAFVGSY
jgi:hypothetical protein